MSQPSFPLPERLRQRFPGLSGRPTPAIRQSIEQAINTLRDKIDELAVEGQFNEAARLESENFQDLVALYGLEAPRTLRSLENMSSFSFGCGDYGNGEKILDQLIDLRTKVQGKNHSEVLAAIASKVGALHQLGRSEEAEEVGLDCLERCEEHLKPDDTATLRVASNLASIYTAQGDLGNAEKLCVKVLKIREQTLPDDDTDIVRSKVNLSGVYFGQKRWGDAAFLLESILGIRRSTLGDGHASTLKIAAQLEYAYQQLERWKDVKTMQLLILEARKKRPGDEDDETLDSMEKLVATYVKLQSWNDASEMIQKVLVVKKKNPSDHPEIAKLEEILDAVTREIASQESLRHRNNTFIYDTLNSEKHEIRLVYIEKSATNDPLQAHLVPVSLDDDPSFEALSYVWGDQQHPGILNLNGHELEITNNLKAALLQLRLETKDRVLWVDAICINQEDLKERSEQVQMMREIYSKAKRTIVWLGEPEADSDLAMTFLKKLETHPAPEEFALNTLNSIQDDTLYDSLQSLLVKRPYWRRLWIIQELFCARDVVVHCGKHAVTYSTMQSLRKAFGDAFPKVEYAMMLKREKFISKIISSGPKRMNEQPQSENEGVPLLQLLTTHKNALCTDMRDRIYGLLGISSLRTSTHPGLKIDYTKSTSEVYKGAAQAIIEETESLDVICMNCEAVTRPDTGEYRPRQPYLPTWAPDWNVIDFSYPLFVSYPKAKANGNFRSRAKFSADGNVLRTEGICIAPISYCSGRFQVTNTRYQDMVRSLLGWRLLTQAHLGIHPFQPADARLDQFYRLIVFENISFDKILPDVKNWWQEWQNQLLQRRSVDDIIIAPYQKGYLQIIFDFCAGKRLLYFESPLGCSPPSFKLGVCPNETKEGDLLCVLMGCRYPVVLRRKRNYHIIVGEALVPEYMDGKAVDEMRDGTLKAQDFIIY